MDDNGLGLWNQAQQEYPILKGLGLAYKYNPGGGTGFLESWPADEVGTPERPRPPEFPIGQQGLEVYDPKTRPIDMIGDATSHFMIDSDPTIAQQDIYEVAGRRLTLPSRQYGGPRYPMYEPEDAWASNFGAASGVQSAAERASKQYGGADVLGLYTKMGADSYYYAQHLSDALMKNIMPKLIINCIPSFRCFSINRIYQGNKN